MQVTIMDANPLIKYYSDRNGVKKCLFTFTFSLVTFADWLVTNLYRTKLNCKISNDLTTYAAWISKSLQKYEFGHVSN